MGEEVHIDIDQVYLKPPLGKGGGGAHPWKVTIIPNRLFPETGKPYALVERGTTWDSKFSFIKIEVTNQEEVLKDGLEIMGASIIYISHIIDTEEAELAIIVDGQFDFVLPAEAFDDPEIEVTAIQYPIARIVNNPDPPENPTPAQQFIVEQLSSTALVKMDYCKDGIALPSFTPR